MAARRSTNSFDEKRSRLTHTARILRCGGWDRDSHALYDAGDAIAGGQANWLITSERIEDNDYTVCCFAAVEQAEAMARWAADNRMHRTREQRAAEEAEALRARQGNEAAIQAVVERAIAEGVCQHVVQAARLAIWNGNADCSADAVAHAALIGAWPDRPHENTREHAEAMVRWARKHHGTWFDRCRHRGR